MPRVRLLCVDDRREKCCVDPIALPPFLDWPSYQIVLECCGILKRYAKRKPGYLIDRPGCTAWRWCPRPWRSHGEKAARTCSGCLARLGTPDDGATETTARPNKMVSHDPIKDYMRRHACGFPDALDALAAQLGPPTAHDIRRALQTLGRAGAPVDLLEALEAWSADQIQQAA